MPLDFKPGEPFDARKIGQLILQNALRTPLPGGPGVRTLRRPNGYIQTYRGQSNFFPEIWRVKLQGSKENLKLSIRRGLVNGVEPVIGDNPPIPISGKPPATKDGEATPPPQLAVPVEAFDENSGVALLYLAATLGKDWSLLSISPVCFPKKPEVKPFTAYKPLGFILTSGGLRFEQMCFHNLGLGTLFSRTPAGRAKYVWYAT